MYISDSKEVEKTLDQPNVHNQWIARYRTKENEKFFEQAIDYVTSGLILMSIPNY